MASTFARRLVTFDHREIDDLRRSLFELSTTRCHTDYDRAFPGLRGLIVTGQATSRGTVSDVYASDIDDDTASVIALVRTTTSGRAGRRSGEFYMRVDLVRRDGRWLVDLATELGAGRAAPAEGGARTSAPVTSSESPTTG